METNAEQFEEDLEKEKMLRKIKRLKEEIAPVILKIEGHSWYSNFDFRGKRLEWNIKVYRDDYSGKTGDEKVDSKWDKLWEKYVESRDSFFWDCCEDGLSFVGDKKSRMWNWNEGMSSVDGIDISKSDYTLWQTGRMGGHLILEEFERNRINHDEIEELCGLIDENLDLDSYIYDIEKDLESLENLDIDFWKRLLVFCESLDKFDASEEWNQQCNFRRSEKEHEWKEGDLGDFDNDFLEELLEDKETHKSVKAKIREYLGHIHLVDNELKLQTA